MDKHGEVSKKKITKSQKKLSPSEVASIIEEYRNDSTSYELAEKYGCNRHTITRHLKKHGIEVTIKKLNKAEEKEAIHLYERGLTVNEVAEHFSISYSAMLRFRHRKEVKIRTK